MDFVEGIESQRSFEERKCCRLTENRRSKIKEDQHLGIS